MATDAAANNTETTHSPDFDGFITEPPYCYGWTKNANGVKVPVFPYVISILGHLNLKKLGVPKESEERSTKLMKDTLALNLEQIIRQWQAKRHFWQQKSSFPLIILINIADKIGEMITDVVEELQKKYPFVRLIAVLPLPKDEFVKQLKSEGEDEEKILAFEKRYDEFKRDDTNNQKYIWELSEREMPHIAKTSKTRKWRMFNEFVAQHSHLMIVFWQGEKDKWKDQEDSLTWVVRYKLEGYPGLSRHGQADLITHPATGPVLHIQTDADTLQNSQNYLPIHFYSDRAIITKEINEKRELIISDPKFWDLEQLRHTWLGRKFSDIGRRPEIEKNCKVLKDLNYACQDKRVRLNKKTPLSNPPLRPFVEDFVLQRYHDSHKQIRKEDIPETDDPTGQLIAHYCILEKLSKYYKNKTYKLINWYCRTFLILFFFSALLIFLNDICIMGFGVNVFRLTTYYTTQWLPAQQIPADAQIVESLADSAQQIVHQVTPNADLDARIASEAANVSRIILAFLASITAVILSIITIICCCFSLVRNGWHYKYHQFRTLVDCLKVQIFWKLAGMDYSVSSNFRSHQIPAMDWLLMALNGLNITVPNSEKIESTEKLKERFKMLDTIWVEDQIRLFDEIFKTRFFNFVCSKLTYVSTLTALAIASTIPFLAIFFIADIGARLDFRDSVSLAATWTFILWLAIGAWFVLKVIQKWLEKNLKWAEKYYTGFYGFLGNIYRTIKQRFNSKRYFHVPFSSKLFRTTIIFVVCFGTFFELRRLNLIYEAAQCPSVEHLYNPLMAIRLVIQIILSAMAVWWLYNRMGLFAKSRHRIEQLYYPFTMADYSIDMMLGDERAVENINSGLWYRVASWFDLTPDQGKEVTTDPDDKDKVQLCQQILLELGKEVLAKRADWLLAYSDRNLQSPK